MQTRCPACQTLYRIDEDVLQRAGGQARCFRCDEVFNAYGNKVEHAGPELGDSLDDVDTDGFANGTVDPDTTSVFSELTELPDVPDPSGLDPDSALDLDGLTDSLSTRQPNREPGTPVAGQPVETSVSDAGALPIDDADTLDPDPLDVPSDLAPDTLRDAPAPTPAAALRQPSPYPALALATLLLVAALAQLAWFNRDLVLGTPQGMTIAEGLCQVVGCELPPRRAPSRYTVLHRDIGAAPGQPQVLQMQLRFRNEADFAQPLPDIQLSMYDSEEKLTARRRLHPDEYLFPAPPTNTLVNPGDEISVTLQLEDPGRHTTGFKLEFL